MGRVDSAARNILFGYIGNIIKIVIGLISRSVFLYILGATYLGVNGLYINIISVLSLAELGIGTAMNYSLYKPVANHDYEKIKSLMNLYKRAYTLIAFIIASLGLIFVPFIKYVIKDPGNIGFERLIIYYLIFLFNTVSTYFVAYKYSLVNAEQKDYIQTNIHTVTTLIIAVAQIFILLIFKNFLFFLLTEVVIGLAQKIYASKYLNKMYPYLREKNVQRLSKEDTKSLKNNITALMFHKFGEISVHQTDNIIISSFLNVTIVGLISNYNLLINAVSGFINIIFSSVVAGFGNLIVTENKEKQFQLFKVYKFLAFWLYGFAAIAFFILLTPFITLWIGKEMVISKIVVGLMMTNYYFLGHRIVINNFKRAAGLFNADKLIPIIQAVVNLVVSIVLVQKLGLMGIYIGTICSGLVSTFTKPYIVYKNLFNRSVIDYYKDAIAYLLAVIGVLLTLEFIKGKVLVETTFLTFSIMVLLTVVIPNIMFYLLFRNRSEFEYLSSIIKLKLFRRK